MVLVIGHRGTRMGRIENALETAELSIKKGADIIEADVRFTKDKQLVIMHDSTINRMTNGRGKLNHYTLKQLKKFHLNNGEPIPTLSKLIDLVKKYSLIRSIGLMIEVKEVGAEIGVLNLLNRKHFYDVWIASTHLAAIKRAKRINPKIKTVLISISGTNIVERAINVNADYIAPGHYSVTYSMVLKAAKKKIKVFPWVVNTRKQVRKMQNHFVDGIITDNVTLTKEIISKPTITARIINLFRFSFYDEDIEVSDSKKKN